MGFDKCKAEMKPHKPLALLSKHCTRLAKKRNVSNESFPTSARQLKKYPTLRVMRKRRGRMHCGDLCPSSASVMQSSWLKFTNKAINRPKRQKKTKTRKRNRPRTRSNYDGRNESANMQAARVAPGTGINRARAGKSTSALTIHPRRPQCSELCHLAVADSTKSFFLHIYYLLSPVPPCSRLRTQLTE